MVEFFRTYAGYILSIIILIAYFIKEMANYKQRTALRFKTEADAKTANLDYSEALRESYKETASEWKARYDEEKSVNAELIQSNKLCLENISKEQVLKASYIEEIHKLREEVQELKNIILKFQVQFPELFKTLSDINKIKI